MTREDTARHEKTRQGTARHEKARQGTRRHGKAREGTRRHEGTGHEKARARGHGARGHRIYPIRFLSVNCSEVGSPYSCKDRRTCLRRCFKEDFKDVKYRLKNFLVKYQSLRSF